MYKYMNNLSSSHRTQMNILQSHSTRTLTMITALGECCEISFSSPAWAVAPGQAVVVYRGDRVLGGGWISRAITAP